MKTKEKVIGLVLVVSVILLIALQNPVLADSMIEPPGPINETPVNIELREYTGKLIIITKNATIKKGTATLYAERLADKIRYRFVICTFEDLGGGCGATPWSNWVPAKGNDRVWIIKNGNFKAILGKRGLATIKTKNQLTIMKLKLV